MRVLLLGAGGMLAQDLIGLAPGSVDLVTRTSAELDVTGPEVVDAIRTIAPDVVLNAAAYTAVDGAELESDRAFAVNGRALAVIGRAARAVDATVLHYSTDHVFNGRADRPYREDDPADPLSVYGASKLEGERALAASGAKHVIVRTQWLFGIGGRSFPRVMWDRATTRQPTRVVNDQFGRPTYTVDLASATWHLLGTGAVEPPLVHVANGGAATWYDVAKHVFTVVGAADLLTPCSTSEYPTRARRPARSALDTDRFERLAGYSLPPWREALERFLAALASESHSSFTRAR